MSELVGESANGLIDYVVLGRALCAVLQLGASRDSALVAGRLETNDSHHSNGGFSF